MKVVAHLRGGKLVKGYAEELPISDPKDLLTQGTLHLPAEIALKTVGSGELVRVQVQELKALFFVRSFEGRREHDEVKFFESHPPIEGLWVRLRFYDNECIEGVVHNSLHHLVNVGFLLKPPDPKSNNQAMYVLKASLLEFRVLGVKSTY